MTALNTQDFLARQNHLVQFVESCMVDGYHYGSIIGDRKTLLKPGAELLRDWFGLNVEIDLIEQTMDWTGESTGGLPLFYFRYNATAYRGVERLVNADGSCNSLEKRYAHRWVKSVPPHLEPSQLETRINRAEEADWMLEKRQTDGKYGKPESYWQQFDEAIANNTAIIFQREKRGGRPGTETVYKVEVVEYKIPNPDIFDLVGTIQKIGLKRAFVAVILLATGSSALFTQDVEDTGQLGPIVKWLPSWAEFRARVMPSIPLLLRNDTTDAEKASTISAILKDKFDMVKWDSALAGDAHVYLLEREKAEGELITASGVLPQEYLIWRDAMIPKLPSLMAGAETPQDKISLMNTLLLQRYDILGAWTSEIQVQAEAEMLGLEKQTANPTFTAYEGYQWLVNIGRKATDNAVIQERVNQPMPSTNPDDEGHWRGLYHDLLAELQEEGLEFEAPIIVPQLGVGNV